MVEQLAQLAEQPAWATLGERLARARDDERDVAALAEGLDGIHAAILARALDALAGRTRLIPAPDSLRPFVVAVVGAALRRRDGTSGQDDEEEAALDAALDQLAGIETWAALAAQLRQVANGGDQVEWHGLDAIDVAILATALRDLDKGH